MVNWGQIERDLEDAGYSDFEFDTGETAVPGLSGSWLVGKIEREGGLERENLPYLWKLLDALPFGSAAPTDPEFAPDARRTELTFARKAPTEAKSVPSVPDPNKVEQRSNR